jgi:hypothetical protein
VDDARQLMKSIDPSLGVPLPDKDYGGSCRIYDWEHPEDPFHFFKVREKQIEILLVNFSLFVIIRIKWMFLLCHIFLVGG